MVIVKENVYDMNVIINYHKNHFLPLLLSPPHLTKKLKCKKISITFQTHLKTNKVMMDMAIPMLEGSNI